jgi:hypothetical protein
MVLDIIDPKVGEQCDHGDNDQDGIAEAVSHVWLGGEEVERYNPKHPNGYFVLKYKGYFIRGHIKLESNMLEWTQLNQVFGRGNISIILNISIVHIKDYLRNLLRLELLLLL